MNSSDATSSDDWRRQAKAELEAAKSLAASGHWQQSYWHAGFAVECALKCRIMHLHGMNRWPDRAERRDLYSHDLTRLAREAGITDRLMDALQAADSIGIAWSVAKDWSNETKYDPKPFPHARARDMLNAINDAGLLRWILTQ